MTDTSTLGGTFKLFITRRINRIGQPALLYLFLIALISVWKSDEFFFNLGNLPIYGISFMTFRRFRYPRYLKFCVFSTDKSGVITSLFKTILESRNFFVYTWEKTIYVFTQCIFSVFIAFGIYVIKESFVKAWVEGTYNCILRSFTYVFQPGLPISAMIHS